MGRRPNAVVQEFFYRGEKLNDASNRYAHTCKRCGELFPKGRVDGLMGHLVRKCPNVSPEDREFVYQATQHHPAGSGRFGAENRHQNLLTEGYGVQDLSVSQTLQSGQSALDTLAEVSRRHLDYSTHRHSPEGGHDSEFIDSGREIAEQALLAQLQNGALMSTAENSAPIVHVDKHHFDLDGGVTAHDHESDIPLTLGSFPLMQAATAANEHMAQEATGPSTTGTVDPQLGAIEMQLTAQLTGGGINNDAVPLLWHEPNALNTRNYAELSTMTASNDATAVYGPLQRLNKSRVRGKFSDSRRKEVQEIRKRGACMRCRMLKKPCSEGTPCNTCRTIESARLWKSACLRTRLADEFTLWSTGLFHSKARIEVPASVHGMEQIVLPGRIEAALFDDRTWCMSFAVRMYSSNLSVGADEKTQPRHQAHDEAERPESAYLPPQRAREGDEIMLLDEGEGMTVKIEEYINLISSSDNNMATHLLLKKTLESSLEVIRQDDEEASGGPGAQVSRPCYNLQNQLLRNVIELWLETAFLASKETGLLRLQYNPSKQPLSRPDETEWTAHVDADISQSGSLSARSMRLIHAQLLAATETRCLALGKSIVNELERRLLQRQQVSRFTTCLSAVILLNCIERMTGLYRAFDIDSTREPQLTGDPTTGQASDGIRSHAIESIGEPPRPADWPLDDPPHRMWPQGEHFADLLIMLLRMRGLPPKTRGTDADDLVVDQNTSLSLGLNGRPLKDVDGNQVELLAAWLDPLHLKVDELAKLRDGPLPDHEAIVTAWDMRFIARLLLPQSTG